MTIVKLYKHMSDNQCRLVEAKGFGGLLNVAFSQVLPELCNWLLDCYDAESSELVFPGRGTIPVTEDTVHRVLGIPNGDQVIRCELDASATAVMRQQFGNPKGKQPMISQLVKFLETNKSANNKYMRTWAIVAASSLICPTFSLRVSPAVSDATSIGEKNWCELVIRVLKQN
ncbi:unnamed protein product [Urochloa humidicola]